MLRQCFSKLLTLHPTPTHTLVLFFVVFEILFAFSNERFSWLLFGVKDTVDVKEQKTKGQKNEKNNKR